MREATLKEYSRPPGAPHTPSQSVPSQRCFLCAPAMHCRHAPVTAACLPFGLACLPHPRFREITHAAVCSRGFLPVAFFPWLRGIPPSDYSTLHGSVLLSVDTCVVSALGLLPVS